MRAWLATVVGAGRAAIARLLSWRLGKWAITIDEGRLRHIFRSADGHFADDTPANRRLLLRVARNPASQLGEDRFGVIWAAQMMPNGSQIWLQIRNGQIINGGLNSTRRIFNFTAGGSAAPKQGTKK